LQQSVVVDLSTINIQDEIIPHSSAAGQTVNTRLMTDHEVKSSEDVGLLRSHIILATAEPQPVKCSEVAGEKNSAKRAPVKSSNTLKRKTGLFHEPRAKLVKRDQKHKHESTSAAWTESLFVSEVSEVASAVDREDVSTVKPSVDASSIVTSASSVGDSELEKVSLKKFPQQTSVCSTQLPAELITAVDSNLTDILTLPAASGQILLQSDDVCPGSTTADECRSSNATSISVNTCLLKSPPAVQRTLLTGLRSDTPESFPSTVVQIVRPSLSVSSSASSGTKSYPSSPSETTLRVPVHTDSGNMSAVSVRQLRPASTICKLQTATVGQTLSITAAASRAAEQCNGTSVSVSSQIPSQSHSSLHSKPPVNSTSKSVIRIVVPPQNTDSRRSVLACGQQFRPQHRMLSDESEHLVSSCVRQSQPSASVCARRQCSASAVAAPRQTLSVVAGRSGSQCSPRPILTRARAVPQQTIRIRVNAADLGNAADPSDVMNHVCGILSRTNTILPGAQIRIRYMPPVTSSQTATVQSSITPQTTAAEHVNTRVSQLDGTADSDDDPETTAVKQSENTRSSSTDVDSKNVSAVHSTRSKTANADDLPASDSRVR